MNALVTGGAGFIGAHLCRALLHAGYRVTAVDNFVTGRLENVEALLGHERFQLVGGDACDYPPPGRDVPTPGVIFHLAGIASPPFYLPRPVETARAGVEATANMLRLAHKHGARLVFASTSEVYGDPEFEEQREDYCGRVNPWAPRSVYDESKRLGEGLCYAFRQRGVDARVARLFNTYGPGMRLDDGRALPEFVKHAIRGTAPVITGGAQTRSFCYVSDTVAGLLAMAAMLTVEGPINIGNPHEEHTVDALWEMTRLVAQERGHAPVDAVREGLPQGDPRRRRPNIERATRLLDWVPTVSLRAGLARTFDDFEARLSRGAHRDATSSAAAAAAS